MPYDVDSDLAAAVPFELRPVPRVSHVGVEEFDRLCRRSSVPVIIEDALDDWPAVSAWQDHRRLLELVGADSEVFCRQVADPAADFQEDYEPVRFGQLVEEVFEQGTSRNYLTQGLVFRPQGFLARIGRSTYPALLDALAVDCRLPPFVDPDGLLEGCSGSGAEARSRPCTSTRRRTSTPRSAVVSSGCSSRRASSGACASTARRPEARSRPASSS